jgi:hypothetical protein
LKKKIGAMKTMRTLLSIFLLLFFGGLMLSGRHVWAQGKKPIPDSQPGPPVTKTKLEVKEFGGDFENWVKSLTIESPQKLNFRYSTDQPGAVSAIWQVSDGPIDSGLQANIEKAPHIIASGSAGDVPAPGHVGWFQINFALIAAPTPSFSPDRYWVRIVTKDARARPVGIASGSVRIIYSKPATAPTFDGPELPPEGLQIFARLADNTLGHVTKFEKTDAFSAQAVWESLGGKLGDAPGVCRIFGADDKGPSAFVVVVDSEGYISSTYFTSDGKTPDWLRWNNRFSSRASCGTTNFTQYINYDKNRPVYRQVLHVFGRSWGDNQVSHSSYYDGRWHPEPLGGGKSGVLGKIGVEIWGGQTSEAPAMAAGENDLDVFVKGTDAHVWERSSNTKDKWQRWNEGFRITSSPSAFYAPLPRTDSGPASVRYIFARGEDGAVWYNNQFGGWKSLGGKIVGTPYACALNYEIHVFARSPENVLLYKKIPKDSQSETTKWTSLGGGITSDPVCVHF